MVNNPKSNLSLFTVKRVILSFLVVSLFIGSITARISTNTFAMEESDTDNYAANVGAANVGEHNEDVTIPFDIVFSGYDQDYINLTYFNENVVDLVSYPFVDVMYHPITSAYIGHLSMDMILEFNYHFTSESYDTELDIFIDTISWDANTSALNTTQLNLQEDTGERLSIFYDQEGKAINGTELEHFLAITPGYTSTGPSYVIYFLNQSRFDSADHSSEHWFEIDEVDPDSNVTADWWRLEWDNDLNAGVEYPYPCWGFQNRLFMIDPFSHQWYTKWTDIWWNEDVDEGEINYKTTDLDTYLEGYTPGTSDYMYRLNGYLVDYLNDITTDVGARSDGLLYDQKEISAQVLLINNETDHGYSREDLNWIYHEEIIEEAFEYVVPQDVCNITFEDNWVNLNESLDLLQVVNDNIMDHTELGSYPWYRPDWTYLDGVGIFYGFEALADNYFDMDKGDSLFTSWVLLLQNVSMIAQAYGEYREFTGLGGGGNVVCFKDLNRYFDTDGVTPRSGLTTLLVHEVGHVLGFMHAEFTNDADEGPGGFMRDVMSYYSEGTAYFSKFLKDSLHRTSSYAAYYRNKDLIDDYRANSQQIDAAIDEGETAMDAMNYLEAFRSYKKLYDLTDYLPLIFSTNFTMPTPPVSLPPALLLVPLGLFFLMLKKRKKMS
ncbi:MAG: hypothetical protein ACTSR1_13040 [Candidatus Heimdallarchaeota archaeon]